MGRLVLSKRPSLRAPYLIAGFGGWPNGGGVSTDSVEFLQSYFAAERIGEIASEDLYIYSSPALASRPVTVIRGGLLESLRFPSNTLFAWERQEAAHDILLLQGIEPDLHWQQFADAIMECLRTFEVQRVYTVGGYLDYAPHTRVPRISAVVTHDTLRAELESYDIDMTDYEGPTSIQSYLLSLCQQVGIEGVSLWIGTPSYIQSAYPRVTQHILSLLGRMWGMSMQLNELEEQASELEATLQEQIDSNPELLDYIKRLEQAYDQAEDEPPDMDADAIVDEIQQFLRRQRDNPLGNDEP